MSNDWVDVVFMQGDDFDLMREELGDKDSFQDIAEYLAQWDYGDETDMAHTKSFEDGDMPGGLSDVPRWVEVGGTHYVVVVNGSYGYASLNRRPLS